MGRWAFVSYLIRRRNKSIVFKLQPKVGSPSNVGAGEAETNIGYPTPLLVFSFAWNGEVRLVTQGKDKGKVEPTEIWSC